MPDFLPNLYGVSLAAGILVSYILAVKNAPRFYIARVVVENALPYLVLAGFVGARLYYVLFSAHWHYFLAYPAEILAFWHGGIAIYGAILGGGAAAVIYAKTKRIGVMNILNLFALALPLGQAIGRFGNYFNQEAFGEPTALPWKIYIAPQFRPFPYLDFQYFHPTFLYEAVWDVLIFLILWRLAKRQTAIFGVYLILYGLGRFFIEGIRLDSFFILNFRVDQLVSLLAMLGGAAVLLAMRKYEQSPA
ncbi:MAG: prolipoprotein diacylglyceryl transferase [Candidatus Doudnabacteria bacterium]|nr:prolipoprotein diacylglyceryl transferase [Candidatus Doudnabacteria bacterium]